MYTRKNIIWFFTRGRRNGREKKPQDLKEFSRSLFYYETPIYFLDQPSDRDPETKRKKQHDRPFFPSLDTLIPVIFLPTNGYIYVHYIDYAQKAMYKKNKIRSI